MMAVSGIGPNVTPPVRVLGVNSPDLLAKLLVPGRMLEADVVSVFSDRAILSFGAGLRLEVDLKAALKEGQRVRVEVQPPHVGVPQEVGGNAITTLKLVNTGLGSTASDQPGQTMKTNSDQAQQALGQVGWIPVPLPNGQQGWAQIQVKRPPDRGADGAVDERPYRVRVWWETPQLGPVEVTMDAAGCNLTALITSAIVETRQHMEGSLPDLQERLGAVGFPDAKVGCRQVAPGEQLEPIQDGGRRLDRRL